MGSICRIGGNKHVELPIENTFFLSVHAVKILISKQCSNNLINDHSQPILGILVSRDSLTIPCHTTMKCGVGSHHKYNY